MLRSNLKLFTGIISAFERDRTLSDFLFSFPKRYCAWTRMFLDAHRSLHCPDLLHKRFHERSINFFYRFMTVSERFKIIFKQKRSWNAQKRYGTFMKTVMQKARNDEWSGTLWGWKTSCFAWSTVRNVCKIAFRLQSNSLKESLNLIIKVIFIR